MPLPPYTNSASSKVEPIFSNLFEFVTDSISDDLLLLCKSYIIDTTDNKIELIFQTTRENIADIIAVKENSNNGAVSHCFRISQHDKSGSIFMNIDLSLLRFVGFKIDTTNQDLLEIGVTYSFEQIQFTFA